ncbi:uncharacterized protein Dere_GG26180 [Drosophila erecta]|uniref:EMI domain-containing protein n=2 Tax=Drosophila erecta TaxID=7220 RepID=A0A0Q5WJ98_DROER|nr:uncharacterized protein Dere_GG26180 [Drosophila erecta]
MTYEIASCDEDAHLCRQLETVNYTETVTRPIEDYGSFAKYFKELRISAGKKNVTLTKLEEKEVCCPGFEKSSDEKCVPIPPTTTMETTSTTKTKHLTESESSSLQTHSTGQENAVKPVTKSINIPKYLIFAICIGIGALIIVIAVVITLRIRQKRRLRFYTDSRIVKFNCDMQSALL